MEEYELKIGYYTLYFNENDRKTCCNIKCNNKKVGTLEESGFHIIYVEEYKDEFIIEEYKEGIELVSTYPFKRFQLCDKCFVKIIVLTVTYYMDKKDIDEKILKLVGEVKLEWFHDEFEIWKRDDGGSNGIKAIIKRQNEIIRVIEAFKGLSLDDRATVVSEFCHNCWTDNPLCQCWNDE